MKQLRQRWPRRDAMMKAPFVPLSDVDFRRFVADHSAIPIQRGNSLFVAKWIDGPGMDPEQFLAAVRSRGSTLEVRDYHGDVNIRVVEGDAPESRSRAPSGRSDRPVATG